MRRKRFLLACAVALCATGVAMAARYGWMGNGGDDNWDSCKNWVLVGFGLCYPSTTSDDAEVGKTADINLINEEIDDLTISADVDFASAGGTPILTVDSLTLDASEGAVTVTISGAFIQTN